MAGWLVVAVLLAFRPCSLPSFHHRQNERTSESGGDCWHDEDYYSWLGETFRFLFCSVLFFGASSSPVILSSSPTMASSKNTNSATNINSKQPPSFKNNNSHNKKKNAAAPAPTTTTATATAARQRILVLHGNRQTGPLLLGRLDKLRKKLRTQLPGGGVELVAIDAPFLAHPEDDSNNLMRTWWNRSENLYEGLEESMDLVEQTWNGGSSNDNSNSNSGSNNSSNTPFVGLLGFSQGARLAHLLAVRHERSLRQRQRQQSNNNGSAATTSNESKVFLPGLRFTIQVAGYDTSPALPDNFFPWTDTMEEDEATRNSSQQQLVRLHPPSLHVWGESDRLILPAQSEAVAQRYYQNAETHVHDGGHHVPMKAASVRHFVEFVRRHTTTTAAAAAVVVPNDANASVNCGSGSGNVVENAPKQKEKEEEESRQREEPHRQSATTYPKKNEPPPQEQQTLNEIVKPDDDAAEQQREEVEALRAIYPDEFHLLSSTRICNEDDDDDGETVVYEHPITYALDVPASDEGVWPPHPIRLHVTYPPDYLSSSSSTTTSNSSIPILQLRHDNDGLQFNSSQSAALLAAVCQAARDEEGNPCVLSCLYAAREFFESGGMMTTATATTTTINDNSDNEATASHDGNSASGDDDDDYDAVASNSATGLLKAASPERIKECNKQGLAIAERLLYGTKNGQRLLDETAAAAGTPSESSSLGGGSSSNSKKGGPWLFTVGLVGKPSAGKSTLFNTATGFARQRQQQQRAAAAEPSSKSSNEDADLDHHHQQLGGATMAPHPFTTIDPNIGYCLVPAPPGSCPEENNNNASSNYRHNNNNNFAVGSTHGRDGRGRRLLPVLLKDVAGLVPGAYRGRGRGNQFLNDLTDADVLVHVLDASGRSDPEGNVVIGEHDDDGGDDDDNDDGTNSNQHGALHPLNDMAWIQNELIEWVYTNLALKWETVRRRGRDKLLGMFSGYGQPQAVTRNLLHAVERYLEQEEHRDRALDRLDEWDSGDLHRLVSAFLGVRFPIALALNKMDLPGSRMHIDDILTALPVHGTYVGTPLSARSEMMFARREIEAVLRGVTAPVAKKDDGAQMPLGTWQCLQSAIGLREPVLVFPVVDHATYAPLPGMFKYATSDPSLPSPGMIACLEAAGGSAPSEWDPVAGQYSVPKAGGGGSKKQSTASSSSICSLRDALIMKPGSTVDDVFVALKKLGALSGEFVRAEASGEIGAPAKPIPKHQVVTKHTRILKIMTNKRTAWQSNYS